MLADKLGFSGIGKWNLFKLAVTDYHNVIVAGGDFGAKPLAVRFFKITLRCHQNVCVGIQFQCFTGKLACQMVWHGNKRFTAQAQPLFFHCGGNHFVSFTRANHMGQQGVVAVQDVGNGIALVGPQCDFRVHAEKLNVTSIIFARANTIKFFIVQRY